MEKPNDKSKDLSINIDLSKLFMQALQESEKGFRNSVLRNKKSRENS